jgi:hypothetical protein
MTFLQHHISELIRKECIGKHSAAFLPSHNFISFYYTPPTHPLPPPPSAPFPLCPSFPLAMVLERQVLYKSNCGAFDTCESDSDLICAAHSDCLAEECEIDTCALLATLRFSFENMDMGWVVVSK